ncbi:hypothetical protein COS33_01730 [Candidatus Wolfebacteria bacterium CG02_land_8_20_14_3_00_37_12]|uniref:Uncharacterized protein n=2 Tax=Candidatus Wolfeibacteriota TaxID=1752735 RepID=A0A2M7CQ31_9BACT|nr:MAG: hypothetical protein COS33_01730 [Candidatus Wolfebacteria bacterium CG02_land_8_20_14_3_00_37_12]
MIFERDIFILYMNTITIPKNLIKNDDLVVIDRMSFEQIFRENKELRLAIKAIMDGEQSLLLGKTRSFKDFLKAKFPEYAKNH